MSDIYESPLVTRYASKEMASLFSMQKRIETWRRLWLELARAEHALGLPITNGQINDLQAHLTDIDFACAEQREKEVRHDVMAHIYAYGKAAPSAAGILHLGATSCYVTDNGDLILYREPPCSGRWLPLRTAGRRSPPSAIPITSRPSWSRSASGRPSGCRICSPT